MGVRVWWSNTPPLVGLGRTKVVGLTLRVVLLSLN